MPDDPTDIFGKAVNSEATLFEVASLDIWQSKVCAANGSLIGWAIRQIVEPRACSIRYLVLYNPHVGSRLLLPAIYVIGAAPGTICSSFPADAIPLLPSYPEHITREYETYLHQQLNCTPYWEEDQLASTHNDPPLM